MYNKLIYFKMFQKDQEINILNRIFNIILKANARVYSKKYFPNVNAEKIYEYIVNEYSEEELINSIIINLTNKEGAVK